MSAVQNRAICSVMPKAAREIPDLFDSALAPVPAHPVVDAHVEPRATATAAASGYSAKDIEVLEGLEPVRRRPGMYIGGTDETALHHLAAEILDNAMDEAVAGLLNNGLVASDVDGETVPAGFSRIMAFRSGLLDTDGDACYTRFP